MNLRFETPPDEPFGPDYATLDLPSFEPPRYPTRASAAWIITLAVVAWGLVLGMGLVAYLLLRGIFA